MSEAPKRGRPRIDTDPQLAAAHADIGRTVWQLMAWGFDLRQQVTPVVARLAAEILKVQNADGRPLTSHRIEQVFEGWMKTATGGWVRDGKALPIGRPWVGISVDSLRERRPFNATLEQLAEHLLRNGGKWTRGRPTHLGDPTHTAKFQRQFLHRPGNKSG